MFYSEKLPLVVVISAFLIFAISGLVTVLKTTHSGIKLDKYLCVSSIPAAYFYNDTGYTTKELYPREYIYDKNLSAREVCSYKKRDFDGKSTPEKYDECRDIYNTVTKSKYKNNECKVLGKEIYEKDKVGCTVLYVWNTKALVSVSCEAPTQELRKESIQELEKKYKR